MPDELNTLLTALYVKIDDDLETGRWMGRPPRLSDAELVTLAVAQALLGFHSEARWLRYANQHLASMFPYLPQQSGYNKRLKAALPLVKKAIRMLAVDTDFWFDNHWIVDSTPLPCGMSRPTVKRSEMAGWAGYGYCASHSRYFWGLRLYLVCTPTGMPILWALANAKTDEREVLQAMLDIDAGLVADRPGLLLISDKGFASKEFEYDLAMRGVTLLRSSFKREKKRKGEGLLKSVRQLIESVNDTLKGQLDLEHHDGRTFEGVAVRVAQRVLAMAAAIWRNHKTGAPTLRSLIAFDH
ncbi:IS982 family transposase [Mycobacteroides abscessus]|uniref:IS982 family transposase n=1 Tax=Mycobacteroides abscessus TaxID=36809 RepID=UPI000C25E82A|nr:IS982 family transposase [Mycobacteroides abscessus]